MVPVLEGVVGKERVHERPMSMGGEDFSQYGRAGVKTFYYWLGTVPQEQWAAALGFVTLKPPFWRSSL